MIQRWLRFSWILQHFRVIFLIFKKILVDFFWRILEWTKNFPVIPSYRGKGPTVHSGENCSLHFPRLVDEFHTYSAGIKSPCGAAFTKLINRIQFKFSSFNLPRQNFVDYC